MSFRLKLGFLQRIYYKKLFTQSALCLSVCLMLNFLSSQRDVNLFRHSHRYHGFDKECT